MSPQKEMVRVIRDVYGLDSPKVLGAMLQVPRERFTPKQYSSFAYMDTAISIGHGQTMSQPATVAFMTDLLGLEGGEKVLEIGTGSGYQAAVLSKLSKEVFTIEINPDFVKIAKKNYKDLGLKNIHVKKGNGKGGWKEHAPFQRIIITAAIKNKVPQKLFEQLDNGGILLSPVGEEDNQIMTKYLKKDNNITKSEHGRYVFVTFKEE
jgi:protein-L-isoaspartate(D-aspartate) O-methyltransferase